MAQQHPTVFVKMHRGLEALQHRIEGKRNSEPTVTVLYGDTGTGKSRRARELCPDDVYIWHPQQASWFDGYEGQKNVIFEEYRGQLPFGFLLSLLDRYDCRVQYKGGSAQFRATNIIITSPVAPRDWYPSLADNEGRLEQLLHPHLSNPSSFSF